MKTWKEVPHLFANGKYNMKESKFQPKKVHEIEGYNSTFRGGCFIYSEGCTINISYCTLIARKIEDLSDEEIRNCPTYKENDITPIEELRLRLWTWAHHRFDEIPAIVQNYLLSIGVYPFDQKAFETGEVIDINVI